MAELFSHGLFLFFGDALHPPLIVGVVVSTGSADLRFDSRIEFSSALVAGPSVCMSDDKLNAPRLSLLQQLEHVLHDDDADDVISKKFIVSGIIEAFAASRMLGDRVSSRTRFDVF